MQNPGRCLRSRSRSLSLTRALCRLTSCMLRRGTAIWSRSCWSSSESTRNWLRLKQTWKYVHVTAGFSEFSSKILFAYTCIFMSYSCHCHFLDTSPECVCLPELCSARGVTVPGTRGTTEHSTKA